MTDEQGYNGWKNYETWSVALIIDNDEGLQRAAVAVVQDAIDFGQGSEYWSEDERKRYRSAEMLKDWVEQWAEVDGLLDVTDRRPMSYLWSQLLQAALSEVDWDEIALHYLEALAEGVTS